MHDLMEPAQDALFAALVALEGDPAMPAGLGVHQHVPEDKQPPLVVLGEMTSENAEDKGDEIELITAEVVYVWRGAGRAPLLEMMRAGRALLQGQEIAADGALFETPYWVSQEATDAMADGVTYLGRQLFRFHAQPA